MKFILKRLAIIYRRFSSLSGSCRVSALDDEVRDEAVEDCVGVVAVETVLEEVLGCEGGLLCEEFEGQVAGGGAQDGLCGGLGLEVVEGGHVEEKDE